MSKNILLSLFLIFFGSPSWASMSCKAILKANTQSAVYPEKLRFASLNAMNLYLHKGKYAWGENGLEKVNQDRLPRQKPEAQTQGLAKAINEIKPDFLLMQEVEGWQSLERFNRRYLNNEYKIFLPKTNDTRNIGIAFLIKESLGFKVKRTSHHNLEWKNPNGLVERVFTRNLPIFEIFKEGESKPRLIIAGVHFKSRRGRKNDPASHFKRTAEIEAATNILKDFRKKFPNVPQMIMGDFNSNRQQMEISDLRFDRKLFDPHLSKEHFIDNAGLGGYTHTYHPYKGDMVKGRFDMALLTTDLVEYLKLSAVYRYKDPKTGLTKRVPQTREERDLNPSDHYPIYFDLDSKLFFD